MGPELDPFEKSIMLLVLAEDIIKKRRWVEQACGYSEDYGNDHILLKAIQKHLKAPDIEPLVVRVVEIIKLGNAEAEARKKQ